MLKRISILILICLSGVCAIAQTEKYTAPVNWDRYKVSGKDVSFLLPKLPVLIQSSNVCIEQETSVYAAYAEGVVYGLNITYKSKQDVPSYCRDKKKFDKSSFAGGIKVIKSFLKTEQEAKVNLNNREIVIVKGNKFTYWLIDDFKNKRWFEFWVTTEDEENQIVKNFIESFKVEENPVGIEIGNGSSRTLGDAPPSDKKSEDETTTKSDKDELTPLRIILKPRSKYTDAARQANVQGTVRLRVTFLASGGIGSVAPVSELPFGLTEQAVSAASKIVFIPGKRKDVNISMIRTVEYSFSIY